MNSLDVFVWDQNCESVSFPPDSVYHTLLSQPKGRGSAVVWMWNVTHRRLGSCIWTPDGGTDCGDCGSLRSMGLAAGSGSLGLESGSSPRPLVLDTWWRQEYQTRVSTSLHPAAPAAVMDCSLPNDDTHSPKCFFLKLSPVNCLIHCLTIHICQRTQVCGVWKCITSIPS